MFGIWLRVMLSVTEYEVLGCISLGFRLVEFGEGIISAVFRVGLRIDFW